MNIRNVLKTYSLLRTLSDDETALLNTLRGMNEGERELLVGSLSPEKPAKTPATRKLEHCGVCDYTRRAVQHKDPNHKDYHEFHTRTERPKKSARAQGLSDTVRSRIRERDAALNDIADDSDDDGSRPRVVGGCAECDKPEDYPIHDPNGGYVTHHPFVSPSSAQRAAGKSSSANGSQSESNPSSETEKEEAGVAVNVK